MNTINGLIFEAMISNGFKNLKLHRDEVNELNVFPVPDGDTGTNICATLDGGLKGMNRVSKEHLGKLAMTCSEGMLLGARGNSGVITSQYFRGIAESLKDLKEATVLDFIHAFENGTKIAYKAVPTPVEGTILTVAREGSEYLLSHQKEISDFETLFKDLLQAMKEALKKTPDLLDVLKEAGVVDSGGAGLIYVIEGMKKEILGEEIKDTSYNGPSSSVTISDESAFNEDSVLTYGYCTEFILQLLKSKCDPSKVELQSFIDYFSTIGDSIVAIKQNSIIKIHVHTKEPWKVIQFAQQYGEFVTFKMENMTIQHNEKLLKENPIEGKDIKLSKDMVREPLKHSKLQTISVAPSEEIASLFKEMGVASTILGGQTMNPSAEDFLKEFSYVNADDIIVFPNNGNVIMTAEQAAKLYPNSRVHVLHSKSVVEAYSALKMLDPSLPMDELLSSMEEQMKSVITCEVSKSIRDSKNNGVEVKKDDFVGILNGDIVSSDPDFLTNIRKMLSHIEDMDDKAIITLFYGKNATEDMRKELLSYLEKDYPMMDVLEVNGGQPVYHFVIAVE